MKIERLVIENFKSIERIELIQPNPFTVFVGPNGSGKSNIFEALEFVNRYSKTAPREVVREFGGVNKIGPRNGADIGRFYFKIQFDKATPPDIKFAYSTINDKTYLPGNDDLGWNSLSPRVVNYFPLRFSRIFIRNVELMKINYQDNELLNFAATNLGQVLKRLLNNDEIRQEIYDTLSLLVPGLKKVEVDERFELYWFEDAHKSHFTTDLVSDGSYNILALLTAIYQSDEPQFLCIEEPENGLHPKAIGEFVNLCRYACQEFGHYIWLNTHSQTLAAQLSPEEIVLVNKKRGVTRTKQVNGMNLHGLAMDEAWLSNALSGGLPW